MSSRGSWFYKLLTTDICTWKTRAWSRFNLLWFLRISCFAIFEGVLFHPRENALCVKRPHRHVRWQYINLNSVWSDLPLIPCLTTSHPGTTHSGAVTCYRNARRVQECVSPEGTKLRLAVTAVEGRLLRCLHCVPQGFGSPPQKKGLHRSETLLDLLRVGLYA